MASPKNRKSPAVRRTARGDINPEQVVRTIIDSMSDGLMVIDQGGEIVFTNPALSAILELAPADMMGRGWGELFFHDPANEDFNQVIVEVITRRIHQYNKQVSYRSGQGRMKELIVTTTLLPGGSGGAAWGGVLAMFKDISELSQIHHRSQELLAQTRRLYQEKLEGLDRLAQAVAHEIRNPITTIGGLASRLLGDKDPASRDARYLRRIMGATQRLELVVEEVRAYADLPTPVRRPIEVVSWLRRAVRPHRARARELGVRLTMHGAGNKAPEVVATFDPELMTRVMDILLQNALEATPERGAVKVGLMCDEISMVVTVSDTGKGLNPADLPYVFDPFFTTKADAVGMSLAIAKRVALEHQGDLSVVSHGRGATFTLSIPRDGVEAQGPAAAKHRPPELK